MSDLNRLAPAIVGAIVALIGLGILLWMNKTQPQLHRHVSVDSEDEPDLPLDEPRSQEPGRSSEGQAR